MSTREFFRRNDRKFDYIMLVSAFGLFTFAVLDWAGLIPYEGYQPKRMVFLTAGMLCQSIAGIVGEKSYRLFYGLLAAAVLLILFSLTMSS
jgi:hypothetical protein